MSDVETSVSYGEVPKLIKCTFCQPRKGVRYYQYAVMFFTLIITSGIHASLSVAIVAMTEEVSTRSGIETYTEWANPDAILSAFFWAAFIPQISGSKLSEKCGPKWLLLITLLMGAVFNIALPPMALDFGSDGVIVCRVFQGLCQGFLYPSIDSLIKEWSPLSQRSRIANVVYGGVTLGVAICMPVAGLMVGSERDWPAVFYVYGTLSIIWAIIVAIFISNSPSTHSSISDNERLLIQGETEESEDSANITPWRSIVKSLPVWAILAAGSAHCWGSFTLLTQIPTYMHYIMNFDIGEDGDVSAYPYIAQLVIGLVAVPLTDKLIEKQVICTTKLRKILTSLGLFLPALFLISLAFIDSSEKNAAIAFLIIAVGTSVLAHSGYYMNVIDLAPNHSGSLFALVNVTTTVFSILGPLTVGFLGDDKKDRMLWRKVFLISAAIYIASGIFYNIFASGEVQAWNWVSESRSGTTLRERLVHLKDEIFSECSFESFCNFVKCRKCRKGTTSTC